MKTLYESILDNEDEVMDDIYSTAEENIIKTFLTRYAVINGTYDIKNGVVNVNGDLRMHGGPLDGDTHIWGSKIKANENCLTTLTGGLFKWGKITGDFILNGQTIKSIKDGPKDVGGDYFLIYCDELDSLEGMPEKIKGTFDCVRCQKLKDLTGAPKEVKHCVIEYCQGIKSLKGCPRIIKGNFDITGCSELESIEGCPEKINGRFIYGSNHKLHNDDLEKLKQMAKKGFKMFKVK